MSALVAVGLPQMQSSSDTDPGCETASLLLASISERLFIGAGAMHPDGCIELCLEREPGNQVSLEILMDGNLDEKSLFLAAIDTATLRATAL